MIAGLVIFGCLILAYFFLSTTAVFRGFDALLKTIYDLLAPIGMLIMCGLVILACELLVEMFSGSFWAVFFSVLICGVILYFVVGFLGLVMMYTAAVFAVILEFFYFILTKLGELSEDALKYFLGIINKRIVLS